MDKKQYELSLWKDVKKGTGSAWYYDEEKITTIASSINPSPLYGYDITLKSNINGDSTLTFTINYNYFDSDKDEIKDNPIFNLLSNESKLKLYIGEPYSCTPTELESLEDEDTEDRWIDFVIKSIAKDSSKNSATVTAKELFVNELGKNGWSVTLDTELENNTGTIEELGTRILSGSDWKVGKNSYKPTEYTEDALFKATIRNTSIISGNSPGSGGGGGGYILTGANRVLDSNASINIYGNSAIYFPYTSLKYNSDSGFWELADTELIQFICVYNGDDSETEISGREINDNDIDDNFLLVDHTFRYNFEVARSTMLEALRSSIIIDTNNYRGKYIVKSTKSHYESQLEQYVKDYNIIDAEAGLPAGSKAYGYTETKYITSASVENYLTNAKNFTSRTAWTRGEVSDGEYPKPIALVGGLNGTDALPEYSKNYLSFDITLGAGETALPLNYYNKGLINSKLSVVNNDDYIVRLKGRWLRSGSTKIILNGDEKNVYIPDSNNILYGPTLSIVVRDANNNEEPIIDSVTMSRGNIDMPICAADENNYATAGFLQNTRNTNRTNRNLQKNTGRTMIPFVDESNYLYRIVKINRTTDIENELLWFKLDFSELDENMNGYNYYIEDIQFFKAEFDLDGYIIFPEDNITATVEHINKYYYLDSENNIIYLTQNDNYYEEIYRENYESVRSLNIKQSNYFNNTQSLAELFKVWVRYKIYHKKNGKLLKFAYNEDESNIYTESTEGNENDELYSEPLTTYHVKKEVIFSQFSPYDKDNFSGFKYGINIKSIQKTIDSNAIATKIIVINNSQEFAKDGSCSIVRANSNPSGENNILNFNYYINSGLLDSRAVMKDLYGETYSDFRYYPRLKEYNNQYTKITDERAAMQLALLQLNADYDVAKNTYINANIKYEEYWAEKEQYDPEDVEEHEKYLSTLILLDNTRKSAMEDRDRLELIISDYNSKIDSITAEATLITNNKESLILEFYKKYSRYLLEGTWNDDSYVDDELYYFEGLKVAAASGVPKISYKIDTVSINSIDEYKLYNFKIGDKTTIEDPTFFGYTDISLNNIVNKTPKKINVIISETSENFDDETKTTITVKNYKNQFDELFQKITASSQSLQYSEGSYARAAGAITSTGAVDSYTLQQSFNNNAFILSGSNNQTVIWDTGTGIEVIDGYNTNSRVRIVGGGIFLTSDGGENWSLGISGEGINTNYLRAGTIDINKIQIIDGNKTTFRWTSKGINAYSFTNTGANFNKFVRFDRYGLYGLNMYGAESFAPVSVDEIEDNSDFSLTWKGLSIGGRIGSGGDLISGSVKLRYNNEYQGLYVNEYVNGIEKQLLYVGGNSYDRDSRYGLFIYDPNMNENSLRALVGKYEGSYGLHLFNKNGEKTLTTDSNGNLALSGTMSSMNYSSGSLGNGWSISNDGTAVFNDATVRGRLSSVVFEYDKTSAIGGDVWISPSLFVPKNTKIVNGIFRLYIPSSNFRDWQYGDTLKLSGNISIDNNIGSYTDLKAIIRDFSLDKTYVGSNFCYDYVDIEIPTFSNGSGYFIDEGNLIFQSGQKYLTTGGNISPINIATETNENQESLAYDENSELNNTECVYYNLGSNYFNNFDDVLVNGALTYNVPFEKAFSNVYGKIISKNLDVATPFITFKMYGIYHINGTASNFDIHIKKKGDKTYSSLISNVDVYNSISEFYFNNDDEEDFTNLNIGDIIIIDSINISIERILLVNADGRIININGANYLSISLIQNCPFLIFVDNIENSENIELIESSESQEIGLYNETNYKKVLNELCDLNTTLLKDTIISKKSDDIELLNYGIYMTAHNGTNKKGPFIDIYNGTVVSPSVRLGRLDGINSTNFNIDENTYGLYSSNIYLELIDGKGGLYIADGFGGSLRYDTDGLRIVGNITATSGKIGGWNIRDNSLISNNIEIHSGSGVEDTYLQSSNFSEDNAYSESWRISGDGSAKFNNIHAYSGIIGGLSIESLSSNVKINSEGVDIGNIENYHMFLSGAGIQLKYNEKSIGQLSSVLEKTNLPGLRIDSIVTDYLNFGKYEWCNLISGANDDGFMLRFNK